MQRAVVNDIVNSLNLQWARLGRQDLMRVVGVLAFDKAGARGRGRAVT